VDAHIFFFCRFTQFLIHVDANVFIGFVEDTVKLKRKCPADWV